ncbi:YycH family regulatory protein [Tuberibacillus sp. Marseille-P3662]|uniref:YycH family regulatory protein n=1 Tax=Tuberibacillus sp. Marseille-P3662 TaxID=1965358 RepID=UPI000A1CE934|nr:two-component system activity regulator YycH [Tuberibacillus sp. Marseille-P3662]
MKRETSKTILLSFLVILSTVLTWNLWSYKGNVRTIEPTKPQQTTIAEARELSQVFHPYQALSFKDSQSVYGTEGKLVSKLYSKILTPKLSLIPKQPSGQINNKKGIMLVYPAPITMNTLQSLFKFKMNDQSLVSGNVLVDRIKIYFDASINKVVYAFMENNNVRPFYATTNEINLQDNYALLSKDAGEVKPYSEVELQGDQSVYVPEFDDMKLRAYEYLYKQIKINDYIRNLFPNTNAVTQTNGKWRDWVRLLYTENQTLFFVNATTNSTSEDSDYLITSFNDINSRKGWTDNFHYSGIEKYENRVTVRYQMNVDNYPIFSMNEAYQSYPASINLTMNNGTVKEMKRTILNLNTSNDYANYSVSIPSSEDVIQKLNDEYGLNTLQDIRLGYQLITKEKTAALRPGWFFKKDDKWLAYKNIFNDSNQTKEHLMGGAKE